MLPKVGDYAIVDLSTSKPGKIRRDSDVSGWQPCSLRIECERVKGAICYFNVRYAASGTDTLPLYSVVVDYTINGLKDRVTVIDTSGHKVARGQLVDGHPVPFHRLLVFDESFLRRSEDKILSRKDRFYERLSRRDHADGTWYVGYVLESGEGRILSAHNQFWRCDEWLWEESQGKESGPMWYADRRRITGVKNK